MPSSSAATSSFSFGLERRGGVLGVAHRAPPHFASTMSQPSPAASRRAASGAAHVPRAACSASTTCPAPCPSRPRFSHSADHRHAGRRVDAHAHEHGALDARARCACARARPAGRRSRCASSQKRASSSSSVRPGEVPARSPGTCLRGPSQASLSSASMRLHRGRVAVGVGGQELDVVGGRRVALGRVLERVAHVALAHARQVEVLGPDLLGPLGDDDDLAGHVLRRVAAAHLDAHLAWRS